MHELRRELEKVKKRRIVRWELHCMCVSVLYFESCFRKGRGRGKHAKRKWYETVTDLSLSVYL